MNNKQDEIKHLKYLHMEYKKKYNSKKQTIEEENKTISENNSIMKQTDILNSNPNSKYNNTTSRQEKNDENDESSKINKNQTSNNTMNSISEHIIGEKENNNKIFSRKVFPLHNINLPIEKKEINDDDQNNNIDINKEITIDMNNKGNKTIKNEEKIKISLNIDKNILKRRGSEFIFDSKIKNKLLYEFKQNLDEKIYELRKKLNLTNLNTEVDHVLEDEQSGRKNVNESNIIKKDNHLSKIVVKNNLENSKNFKKKTISMLESFEFNSVNMDQSSIGPTIQVNNNTLTTINIQKISFDKFLSINQTSLKKSPYLIMLSYMNTKDIFQLFQTNKKIHELFLKVLKIEINTYISNKFRKITKNLFDNYSFYICLEKNLLSRELKINLILKAKIISESLVKKSLNIQYFAYYPCDENQYVQNTFLLDIKNPPLYYWAMKESTNFNQDELNKAYFMNVMQYTIGDYIEFTLNIFTEKGIMDIRKLVWNKITVFKTPDEDFLYYSNENILKREIVDFDVSRYCEMELCKGKWNDIILLDESDIYIGELKNKFEKNFNIMKILFDNVGYYIFKFYLEGIIPGTIGPDEEIGMKIKVLDLNEDKSNETKKNNLVFDRKNEIQMHIGDIFIFYISKNVENLPH
jgi:hypothetical protein